MMGKLPSFSDLLAFEAAARLGSFTGAAAERNVSQPAISRRVAALETDLGIALFNRSQKPLTLTAAGQKLFPVLRLGLAQIQDIIDELRADTVLRSVSICAEPGFIAFWLVPRLGELQRALPDIEIRLVTAPPGNEHRLVGDIEIRFGIVPQVSVQSPYSFLKLSNERVFAVASPLYVNDKTLPLTLEQLLECHLLQLTVDGSNWFDWGSWIEAVGATKPRPLSITRFPDYASLVSAALAGHGIALCWDGLLDSFLEAGSLIRVATQDTHSDRGYFIVYDTRGGAASLERSLPELLRSLINVCSAPNC